jgi:hypothetical protein
MDFNSDLNSFVSNVDIKAEMLFDALLHLGHAESDIYVNYTSTFHRKYRKDVLQLHKNPLNDDETLLDVSRDGFYDILPELVSHDYDNGSLVIDPSDDFKLKRKEEKQARAFFGPLENEFFRFSHKVSKYESQFFENLSATEVVKIIREILLVDNRIPNYLVVRLFFALFDYKNSVKQNIEKIVQLLKQSINEEVLVTRKLQNVAEHINQSNNEDSFLLGVTSTLSNSSQTYLPHYVFTIGPLKKSENLSLFFENGILQLYINAFLNLFLPFHSEFSFQVELELEASKFSLDEKENYKSRLGISTVL